MMRRKRESNPDLVASLREHFRAWYKRSKKTMPEELPGLVDEIEARLCPKPPNKESNNGG